MAEWLVALTFTAGGTESRTYMYMYMYMYCSVQSRSIITFIHIHSPCSIMNCPRIRLKKNEGIFL